MYPYCCENRGNCSNLTALNLDTECPNINVAPTLVKFSDSTEELVITMSGRAVWNAFPEATSEAEGSEIF